MANKAIKFKDSNNNTIYPCPYFPVGAIYISVTNTNPSEYFGGTWEQIKDKFLLACGNTYNNGATGGESTHRLTIDEIPDHSHNFANGGRPLYWDSNLTAMGGLTSGSTVQSTWSAYTQPTGGSKEHNNMPPYLAVYIWKRIK